jgi:hypothetical protein
MATLIIDTYNFITRLKDAGMVEAQAEAIVKGLKEINLDNVATKEDVTALKQDIALLKKDLKEMELRMTIKTAVIVAAVIGFFRVMEAFF